MCILTSVSIAASVLSNHYDAHTPQSINWLSLLVLSHVHFGVYLPTVAGAMCAKGDVGIATHVIRSHFVVLLIEHRRYSTANHENVVGSAVL